MFIEYLCRVRYYCRSNLSAYFYGKKQKKNDYVFVFSGAFGRSDTHGVDGGRNINGHYSSDICLLANKSKL